MSQPICPNCGAKKDDKFKENMPVIITVLDPNSFCPFLVCQACKYRSVYDDFVTPQMMTFQGWTARYEKLQTMGV